jgi:hypothetical protein
MSILTQFDAERDAALAQLLKGVSEDGGFVSKRILSEIISSAFDGGALAGIKKSLTVAENYGGGVAPHIANSIRRSLLR